MKILQRYFLSQIVKSVVFILVAFLGLFAFFDLIGEISSIGRGGYQLHHVFIYILLGFPGYIYELMPFAVLIGTIYAMALFASNLLIASANIGLVFRSARYALENGQ